MGTDREVLTYEEAVERIADGDFVHTFRQSTAGYLLGADFPREDLLSLVKQYPPELSGETATAMKHGIVLEDNLGFLFIATKE